jgi:hypothetical protein
MNKSNERHIFVSILKFLGVFFGVCKMIDISITDIKVEEKMFSKEEAPTRKV